VRRTMTTALATIAASTLVAGLMGLATPTAASAATTPAPIVTGWFGWWASDAQVRRLATESQGVVDEVNMFWWTFAGAANPICVINSSRGFCDPSGDTPWTNAKFDRQRLILQDAGIKVLGSITDLGATYAGQLSPYLDTAKNRRDYARKIARYAQNAGLDGVDLDWENFAFRDRNLGITWAETRPRWVAMIKRLYRELNERGLTLSVTIPGGRAYWGGTTGVYALSEIIDHTDRVRFMTYDYSYNVPGPIGPTGWARDQIEAAIAEVGAENAAKMWVGNPQYGRQWVVNQGSYSAPVYGTNRKCPAGWTPGFYSDTSGAWVSTVMRSIGSPDTARAVAQAEGKQPEWNSTYGEWTFSYTPVINGRFSRDGEFIEQECRVDREVWFGDTRSALTDAQMVPELGIGGIAVWNFGSVQSDFYNRLADYGREIAQAETMLTAKASSAVTFGRKARINVSTSSDRGPAAGATATLLWSPTADNATTATQANAEIVSTITLDAGGAGTFRAPVEQTGYFWVEVAETDSHSAVSSGPLRTRVRWKVTPESRELSSLAGESITLSGAVTPERNGVTIRVQRRTDSGWKTLRRATTDDAGRFEANVRVLRPQEVSYRFVAGRADGLIRGVSPRITLQVTAS